MFRFVLFVNLAKLLIVKYFVIYINFNSKGFKNVFILFASFVIGKLCLIWKLWYQFLTAQIIWNLYNETFNIIHCKLNGWKKIPAYCFKMSIKYLISCTINQIFILQHSSLRTLFHITSDLTWDTFYNWKNSLPGA